MAENDKPRYSRISDLIELVIYMQSKPLGVTINDIMERYTVSRRTAERMRDSLLNALPQVEEIDSDDNFKHWGFRNYTVSHIVSFSPKEIGNIEQLQRRTTNKEMKKELQETVDKLKALNRKQINSIETNIELYLQTEGYAVRQTTQYDIDIKILDTIRHALQTNTKVNGFYHDKKRTLEPLGLIYGAKIYLVAREKAKGDGIYNYLLHKFSNIENTDKTFDRKDFSLQEYTNRSFGVYQGEILHVELKFDKDVAEDALKYNFHPTQRVKANQDGTVTVKFDAGGNKEIIWHVFRWGKNCKIIKPQSLVEEYKNYLQTVIENYS